MNTLFINACPREESRTLRLANRLLARLGGELTQVKLYEKHFPVVDASFIQKRIDYYGQNDYSDPIFDDAKRFAAADQIVIAAPYWDLSFPAALKQYFEQICVLGKTFYYTEDDEPAGLCRAKRLYYVTTAGGPIISDAFGYGYVKALCGYFYGIADTVQIKAEKLDIRGADVEGILRAAEAQIDALVL